MEPILQDEKAVNGLTKGISKLQLTPSEDKQPEANEPDNKRGAAFWEMMPILLKALLHLSNVYTQHGLFNEADYYSQRAICAAESVESNLLVSRVRSHRCRLLVSCRSPSDFPSAAHTVKVHIARSSSKLVKAEVLET